MRSKNWAYVNMLTRVKGHLGGVGLGWVVARTGGGSPRPVCPSLTGTTGPYLGCLVSRPPRLLTTPKAQQGAGGREIPPCLCVSAARVRGRAGGHVGSHHGVVPGPAGATGVPLASVACPAVGFVWRPCPASAHPAQVTCAGRVDLFSLWLCIGPAVGHAWSGEEPHGPELICLVTMGGGGGLGFGRQAGTPPLYFEDAELKTHVRRYSDFRYLGIGG